MSGNKITKLGSFAFISLPGLKELALDDNEIVSISDYAFSFTPTTDGHIVIYMASNNLTSKSFTANTFGKPVHVSVLLDLENNAFTDLPQLIFKPLIEDKRNKLVFYGNKFQCGCSMKWIMEASLMDNILGVYCTDRKSSIFSLTQTDFDNCKK